MAEMAPGQQAAMNYPPQEAVGQFEHLVEHERSVLKQCLVALEHDLEEVTTQLALKEEELYTWEQRIQQIKKDNEVKLRLARANMQAAHGGSVRRRAGRHPAGESKSNLAFIAEGEDECEEEEQDGCAAEEEPVSCAATDAAVLQANSIASAVFVEMQVLRHKWQQVQNRQQPAGMAEAAQATPAAATVAVGQAATVAAASTDAAVAPSAAAVSPPKASAVSPAAAAVASATSPNREGGSASTSSAVPLAPRGARPAPLGGSGERMQSPGMRPIGTTTLHAAASRLRTGAVMQAPAPVLSQSRDPIRSKGYVSTVPSTPTALSRGLRTVSGAPVQASPGAPMTTSALASAAVSHRAGVSSTVHRRVG
eukprot:TRINITY_DN83248_c0_g1_i1.p1 TRINITY_DN83248_c0_g1~~TRINITY_DN83248_c0_g1_i1.p1  ORF type:complete len:367 (-),score=78.76 TRINITY_DN83248_c0_g1_i1:209-1309(-)